MNIKSLFFLQKDREFAKQFAYNWLSVCKRKIMDTFKDRLIYLWKENAKPAVISKDIGMSTPGFNRVWYSDGIPKAETLIKIREVTGCDITWLLTGEGEPFPNAQLKPVEEKIENSSNDPVVYDTLGYEVDIDEFVFIPRYNVHAAAGGGHFNDAEKPMFTMAFRRKWIEQYLRACPKELSVIDVKGDSMDGVLNERDVILVNHYLNTPDDGLYVLRIGDSLIVKQTQLLPNGRILVKSANPAYDPFELNMNETDTDVKIIGRVVWYGRQV